MFSGQMFFLASLIFFQDLGHVKSLFFLECSSEFDICFFLHLGGFNRVVAQINEEDGNKVMDDFFDFSDAIFYIEWDWSS
jgi:hypothetical protein